MQPRLSPKQESIIRIMLSGWLYHKADGTLCLEDADKNCYYVRHPTVQALLDKGYITQSYINAQGDKNYTITQLGLNYLETHHKKDYDDFTG